MNSYCVENGLLHVTCIVQASYMVNRLMDDDMMDARRPYGYGYIPLRCREKSL